MNTEAVTGQPKEIRKGYALFAGIASVVTVIILIAAKTFVYLQSGSVSVLASLTDSCADAVASAINFFAIHYALQPADHEHRHGHGKAEGLAALIQGLFIIGAGIFLLTEAYDRFNDGREIVHYGAAIGVMAFSMLASIVLVAIQNHSLKYAPSLAVEADQAHYSTDVVINGGVIVTLLALKFGAPLWLDPVFAILVALYLGKTAAGIIKKGLDMLLDRELPDDVRSQILSIIKAHEDIKAVHDLRTRKSGMNIHINFDVEIDPDMTLRRAHAVSLEVEKALLAEFPNAEIMIHKDPHGVPHDESRHQIDGLHK